MLQSDRCERQKPRWVSTRPIRALTPILFLLFSLAAAAQDCGVLDPELKGYYAGPCKDGLAEGEGIARGTAEYRGGFRAGKKHGQGVKVWPNGDRYEGGFAEDRREGRGKYSWGRGPWAGESYEGPYVNDKRHGEGEYRWPSGDVYRGRFAEDNFAGYATPMMLARSRFEEEAKRGVGKEGQKVCREMPIGIAHGEWIRGVVVGISGEQVGVRVDEPGVNATGGGGRSSRRRRGVGPADIVDPMLLKNRGQGRITLASGNPALTPIFFDADRFP